MEDPRLSELALLKELDSNPNGIEVHLPTRQEDKPFGLSRDAFRQLILHLLLRRYINDLAQLHTLAGSRTEARLDVEREGTIDKFLRGQPVRIQLNHEGRLRLWSLKDELESNRELDEFGILFRNTTLNRDLRIAATFVPKGKEIALLMCDLDHFKGVNDKMGHEMGNEILKRYFQIVKDAVGPNGAGYRYGGDEVVVVLRETNKHMAVSVAEAIRSGVEKTMKSLQKLKKQTPKPTVSIGLSLFSRELDPLEAIDAVDKLLYKAKRKGRNRVKCGFALKT